MFLIKSGGLFIISWAGTSSKKEGGGVGGSRLHLFFNTAHIQCETWKRLTARLYLSLPLSPCLALIGRQAAFEIARVDAQDVETAWRGKSRWHTCIGLQQPVDYAVAVSLSPLTFAALICISGTGDLDSKSPQVARWVEVSGGPADTLFVKITPTAGLTGARLWFQRRWALARASSARMKVLMGQPE